MNPVLVTGATGPVGRGVIDQLLRVGLPVRALTRRPDQENVDAAAEVLSDAGLDVSTAIVVLMGPDGTFITGSDFLMDGGVTAAYWFGELAPK